MIYGMGDKRGSYPNDGVADPHDEELEVVAVLVKVGDPRDHDLYVHVGEWLVGIHPSILMAYRRAQ